MPETTAQHNGTVRSTVSDTASGMYNRAQRSLDYVVPPSSRQQAYDNTAAFASERPVLFAFAASQAAFSFLPLLLFLVFSLSTVAFALGAALVFALFWIGVAFMLLVPTLLVTFSVAVLVWAWAVGSFVVARWLYDHAPVGVRGNAQVDAAGRKFELVKNDRGIDGKVHHTGPQ